MSRWIIVVVAVAVLSALIARAERSSGAIQEATRSGGADWVRTADGWEPRTALSAQRPTMPIELHPALVATFQMGASLLVLLAFPGQARPLIVE